MIVMFQRTLGSSGASGSYPISLACGGGRLDCPVGVHELIIGSFSVKIPLQLKKVPLKTMETDPGDGKTTGHANHEADYCLRYVRAAMKNPRPTGVSQHEIERSLENIDAVAVLAKASQNGVIEDSCGETPYRRGADDGGEK